jgi:hypothetical protein
MEGSMAKLSEEARKKIADAVRKSWVARRARQASAKPAANSSGRKKLSAAAKRKIAAAVRRSWALRRAGRGSAGSMVAAGGASRGAAVLNAIEQASQTLRKLTLEDIRPLAGQRKAAASLQELATLASELRRLVNA